jgi:hypothetical protein
MEITNNLSDYTQWAALGTIACLLLTIISFILKWGWRFRLVGATGFMVVLTVGIFGLGLGLFTSTKIPGAVRFSLAYDNGANQAVIALPPTVTASEVEATLQQAARDLFSYGRVGVDGDDQLTIRARALLHPKPGVTVPLYLGEVKRTLKTKDDSEIKVELFPKNIAQLQKK